MQVYVLSTLLSKVDVKIHVIEPCRSTDYIADMKKFLLKLSDILDFQIIFMLYSADQAWAILIFISFSVDPI